MKFFFRKKKDFFFRPVPHDLGYTNTLLTSKKCHEIIKKAGKIKKKKIKKTKIDFWFLKQIDELIDKTRAEEFKLHRKSMSRMEKLGDVSRYMPGIDVQTVWVESESKMCGQSLEDIHLRKKYVDF